MPVPAWLVESLRFTVFPVKAFKDAPDWWQTINKEPPEVRNQNPRRGMTHEEGIFSKGRLVVESQPLRADCTYVPNADDETSYEKPPNIGSLTSAIEVFRLAIQQLVRAEHFPETSRIAFGAILLLPVPNKRTGYIEIAKFLPFKIDPDGSSDLIYQINRPKSVTLNGGSVLVNRISKWSVALFKMMAFQIAPDASAVTSTEPLAAIRLELDINNAPVGGRSYGPKEIHALLESLVEKAIEISIKGDRP